MGRKRRNTLQPAPHPAQNTTKLCAGIPEELANADPTRKTHHPADHERLHVPNRSVGGMTAWSALEFWFIDPLCLTR